MYYNNFKLELFKLKRTKTFLYSMVILLIAILWAIAANMNYLSKTDEGTINIIIATFADLNTLFFPIIISIVATKICSIEHKHQTFKYLKAIGINKAQLFKSKTSLLFINLFFMVIIEAICIIITSKTHNLEINFASLTKFFVGNIIAGSILNAIFLFIALKYKSRAIALSLGIIGGFIGIVISRAPLFIKAIIPFGLVNILSPIVVSFDLQNNNLLYLDKPGMNAYYTVYFFIGILLYHTLKKRINEEID